MPFVNTKYTFHLTIPIFKNIVWYFPAIGHTVFSPLNYKILLMESVVII